MWLDPGAVGQGHGWDRELSAGQRPTTAPGETLSLPVPGPLEGLPQTVEYDGVAWLARSFSLSAADAPASGSWRLQFGQVNYHCRAWLDGVLLGAHEGGYEAFSFDLPASLLPGDHVLVLRVLDAGPLATDDLTLATTPHAKESWYHNFGGVLGPVELERLDVTAAEIRWLEVDADASSVLVDVELLGPSNESVVSLTLTVVELPLRAPWPPGSLGLAFPVVAQASARVPLVAGRGRVSLPLALPDARRWSPAAPHRYAVRVAVSGRPPLPAGCRPFGLRSIRLDAQGLRLDGVRQRLHGVLYQPHFVGTGGMTPPPEQLVAELDAMAAAGFNLVRAHVRPAPGALLEEADRTGMLVLEEPAIGWVQDSPALPARLVAEVDAMLERDQHHPSIVIWGLFNELSGKAYRHGDALLEHLSRRDSTRPVLLDSGGFFGRGSYLDAGASEPRPMLDEHLYPPYPLPTRQRRQLLSLASRDGPSFASEYGFGTLLDAASARNGFAERRLRDAEWGLFSGQARAVDEHLSSGEGWTLEGWLPESLELQAAAAIELTEALRANPAVDLLCYTQWQAVSRESSAGLLEPWGQQRPALHALRHALRPLMTLLVPARPSVLQGDVSRPRVAVVVESGHSLQAELLLELQGAHSPQGAGDVVSLGSQRWPEGVTWVEGPELRFDTPGAAHLTPLLRAEGVLLERGRKVTVAVLPPAPPVRAIISLGAGVDGADRSHAVSLFDPTGSEIVSAFAARQGFGLRPSLAGAGAVDTVILLAAPRRLADQVSWDERVQLWQHVDAGGSALVLMPDPAATEFGQMLAGNRGRLHLVDVPLNLEVAAAAGNFMGRVYPLLEAESRIHPGVRTPAFGPPHGGMPGLSARPVVHPGHPDPEPGVSVRLLSADEGDLTPVAMLTGELPEGSRALMLAVGPLGQRLGVPVAMVPFGRGTITFVGLPLLESIDGQTDARRDAVLAHLLLEVASETSWRLDQQSEPFAPQQLVPFPEGERLAATGAEASIRQVVALADRFSALHGGSLPMPAAPALALDELSAAMSDLCRGNRGRGRQHLLSAFAAVWNAETAAFLGLERSVLVDVAELRRRHDDLDLRLAHEAIDLWEQGVSQWFTGDRETAFAWLGRAELLLRESGRLP